jgi:rsbT co-antagonist protein RsbR
MKKTIANNVTELLLEKRDEISTAWAVVLRGVYDEAEISGKDLKEESAEFIHLLADAMSKGNLTDITESEYGEVRNMLAELSRSRAILNFSPSDTATYVFSLKNVMFQFLQDTFPDRPEVQVREMVSLSNLLDKLGLFTFETFALTREEYITRQQRELLEISTPVIQVWDGVLALPVIGTLDSMRTQTLMEALLRELVRTNSTVAILDISGVPAVDTMVAEHLMKTVSAARLMGAECIISGIRPEIAQTIVHLGIDLRGVLTRSTMALALTLALDRLGIDAGSMKSA